MIDGAPRPGWPDLGLFIRAQRDAAQMSVRRLAEAAGVSNPYLSQIERGLRKPSAEILQQIAKALRISVETLYVRAGILDGSGVEPTASVIEAIVGDERLTVEQRHTLITVYESFLAQNVGPVSGAARAAASAAAAPAPAAPSAEPPTVGAPATPAPAAAAAPTRRRASGTTKAAAARPRGSGRRPAGESSGSSEG